MMLNLNIPAETERRIRASASAAGQNIESFVLSAVEAKLATSRPNSLGESAGEFDDWLAECVSKHPQVTSFVDDSRESIYDGRGE